MITPNRVMLAALMTLSVQSATAQTGAQAIAEVIAPPELMAEYTCVTYSAASLRPRIKAYSELRLKASSDRPKTLQALVKTYASLLGAMCADVQLQFQKKRSEVLSIYAAQLPGNSGDISKFLKNGNAKRWASEDVALLRKTASLVELYQFVVEVAPQLFDNPRPSLDSATLSEIRATSVGASAQDERRWLVLLLKDASFAKHAPEAFNLKLLAMDEERLRKESSKLLYATEFGWFNGNASDLARRELLSFDVMRKIDLTPIFGRHEANFQRLTQ